MRSALACVGKKNKPIVSTPFRTAFDHGMLVASQEHWAKIHCTNPPERLNEEIERLTIVVGMFQNAAHAPRGLFTPEEARVSNNQPKEMAAWMNT